MRISDWSSDVCSSDLIVDDGADRNLPDLHRIARLHVHLLARDDLIAGGDALRSQNIGDLPVLILHQRDEGGTVGVIFQALDSRRNVPLAPLEIDERSEEHTSELQSLMRISYAVFCLKKKK